jgi:hypothetical protein
MTSSKCCVKKIQNRNLQEIIYAVIHLCSLCFIPGVLCGYFFLPRRTQRNSLRSQRSKPSSESVFLKLSFHLKHFLKVLKPEMTKPFVFEKRLKVLNRQSYLIIKEYTIEIAS